MKRIGFALIALLVFPTILSAQGPPTNSFGGRPPDGNPVNNSIWVTAGQVVWIQDTTQGIGNANIHSSANILQQNGQVNTTTWDVACNFAANGGYGTGFTIAAPGWLQAVTTYIATGGFPQGAIYTNIYVLNSMPSGGGTSGCTNTLAATQIGQLLTAAPTGSSYPVSFVGTASIPVSPWAIPGYTTVLTTSNPAAGTDWSITIPGLGAAGGGSRTCVIGAFAALTTSAGVANRTVMLQFLFGPGGVPQIDYISGTPATAGQTVNFSWSPGGTAQSLNTSGSTFFQIVPFNNSTPLCFNANVLPLGPHVRTFTTGLQAGDQWSSVALVVQIQQDNN